MIFYDEGIDGYRTFYRPTGDPYAWVSERVSVDTEIPEGFRFSLPMRTIDALADALAAQKFGTRQLDTTVIKALEREQGRVDKLLDWMVS